MQVNIPAPLPSRNAENRSMSLSAVSSPRLTEPNTPIVSTEKTFPNLWKVLREFFEDVLFYGGVFVRHFVMT
jgi:hypothetical protein